MRLRRMSTGAMVASIDVGIAIGGAALNTHDKCLVRPSCECTCPCRHLLSSFWYELSMSQAHAIWTIVSLRFLIWCTYRR